MFGAVGFVARSQFRQRWRALVVITLFVAVVGGTAIALVAGARRSSSVVDRYYAQTIPYTATVFAPDGGLKKTAIESVAGVVRADPEAYLAFVHDDGTITPDDGINSTVVDPGAIDPTIEVLHGTLKHFGAPDAVAVNAAFVKQYGLGVGDTLRVRTFGTDQFDDVNAGRYLHPGGPSYDFHIAAVVRTPADIAGDEIVPVTSSAYGSASAMLVPASFYDAHASEFLTFGQSYDVQLANGPAGLPRFRERVAKVAGGEQALFGPARFSDRRNALESPVDVETIALLALGIGVGIAGAIATWILVRAEQRWHDRDGPALRALGYTGRELRGAAALRYVPVAVAGMLLATVIAIALSSRFPVGIGHQLELDPGIMLNLTVLAVGAVLCGLVVVAAAFASGHGSRATAHSRRGRPTIARWEAKAGAPLDLTLGTHFALDRGRDGRGFAPRQAIAAGAAAVAVVAAIALLLGSVDRLYATPAEHGWPWDVAIGNPNFTLTDALAQRLTRDPHVAAATVVRYGQARIDDDSSYVLAVADGGDAPPDVVSGRLPASSTEIALGGRQLRRAAQAHRRHRDVVGRGRRLRARRQADGSHADHRRYRGRTDPRRR